MITHLRLVHTLVLFLFFALHFSAFSDGLRLKKNGRYDGDVAVFSLTAKQRQHLNSNRVLYLSESQRSLLRDAVQDAPRTIEVFWTKDLMGDCTCDLYNIGLRFSQDSVEVPFDFLISESLASERDSINGYWEKYIPLLEAVRPPQQSTYRWRSQVDLISKGTAYVDSNSVSHIVDFVEHRKGARGIRSLDSPLLDRDTSTALIFPIPEENDTLSFRFTFRGGKQFTFIGVRIANGYQASDSLWLKFARVREAIVHTVWGSKFRVVLEDKMGYQYFALPGSFLIGDDQQEFRIDLLNVHKEHSSGLAALSEIELLGLIYLAPEERK